MGDLVEPGEVQYKFYVLNWLVNLKFVYIAFSGPIQLKFVFLLSTKKVSLVRTLIYKLTLAAWDNIYRILERKYFSIFI